MSICLDIRKRKSGKMYLRIVVDGKTKREVKIDSYEDGRLLAAEVVKAYFDNCDISQDKPKREGYLYIASNESLPTLKIGISKNHPDQRLKQMSTGLPTPFKLEHHARVKDMYDAEEFLHNMLSDYRANGETFDIDVLNATRQFNKAVEYVNNREAAMKRNMMKLATNLHPIKKQV